MSDELEIPEAPPEMNAIAKREWNTICSYMLERGDLKPIDLTMIAAYCTEMATYYDCLRIIDEQGRWHAANNGLQAQRIEVSIGRNSILTAIKIAVQLGITARERKSLEIPTPPKKSEFF